MKKPDNTLWSFLQKKSDYIETSLNILERKQTGSYYTNMTLTDIMMHELEMILRKLV